MNDEVKSSIGVYIDVNTLVEVCEKVKSINSNNHEDIVLVNGSLRVSMTLDEFIERLGLKK